MADGFTRPAPFRWGALVRSLHVVRAPGPYNAAGAAVVACWGLGAYPSIARAPHGFNAVEVGADAFEGPRKSSHIGVEDARCDHGWAWWHGVYPWPSVLESRPVFLDGRPKRTRPPLAMRAAGSGDDAKTKRGRAGVWRGAHRSDVPTTGNRSAYRGLIASLGAPGRLQGRSDGRSDGRRCRRRARPAGRFDGGVFAARCALVHLGRAEKAGRSAKRRRSSVSGIRFGGRRGAARVGALRGDAPPRARCCSRYAGWRRTRWRRAPPR